MSESVRERVPQSECQRASVREGENDISGDQARDERMEELREAFKRVGKDFVPPEAEDFSRFTSEGFGSQVTLCCMW